MKCHGLEWDNPDKQPSKNDEWEMFMEDLKAWESAQGPGGEAKRAKLDIEENLDGPHGAQNTASTNTMSTSSSAMPCDGLVGRSISWLVAVGCSD